MRTMLKGFFGVLTVIALVVSGSGYLYAAPAPAPAPGQALVPGAPAGAPMKMTINQQCTVQVAPTGTAPLGVYTTTSARFSEKDLIAKLADAAACKKSGTFPADLTKAKLYYQWDGAAFGVFVTSAAKTADITVTNTAVITPTCVSLSFPAAADNVAVWSGTENITATVHSEKFTGRYELNLIIDAPNSATETGVYMDLIGVATETLNLPAVKKGAQTLTDSIKFTGGGSGAIIPKGASVVPASGCLLAGTCEPMSCTGTANATGKINK
jgi:hypothetical protein